MKYLVIEIQEFPNGSMSTPAWAFDSAQSAEQKYHTVLAAAAVSNLPNHSCMMANSEGMYIKSEGFKHEQEQAEE